MIHRRGATPEWIRTRSRRCVTTHGSISRSTLTSGSKHLTRYLPDDETAAQGGDGGRNGAGAARFGSRPSENLVGLAEMRRRAQKTWGSGASVMPRARAHLVNPGLSASLHFNITSLVPSSHRPPLTLLRFVRKDCCTRDRVAGGGEGPEPERRGTSSPARSRASSGCESRYAP